MQLDPDCRVRAQEIRKLIVVESIAFSANTPPPPAPQHRHWVLLHQSLGSLVTGPFDSLGLLLTVRSMTHLQTQ